MEVDWDLHAVVRACCSTVSPPQTTAVTPLAWPTLSYTQQKSQPKSQHNTSFYDENLMGFFPDLFQTSSRNDNSIEQFLNNLKTTPLEFQKLQTQPPSSPTLPISPLSVIGGLQDSSLDKQYHYQYEHQQEMKQVMGKPQAFGLSRCTTSNAQSTRSKKRKNQMKRVCQVPAEGLSSDMWSWRKYGQKPIKGSPYPRGYYKCSTSKGCLARKQVERNRSDPDMFIVTYTGDHSHPVPTHRNSLAGSTRNKPTTSDDDVTPKNKPTSSPPVSPQTGQSPATEKTEDNDNDTDDDNFDMVMDDDFFEGLDEIVGPVTGVNSGVIPAILAGGS